MLGVRISLGRLCNSPRHRRPQTNSRPRSRPFYCLPRSPDVVFEKFPLTWGSAEMQEDLAGKDLTDENFAGAYPTGANLTGTDLRGANLTGVVGADLTGAKLE